jgi:integrase
MAIRRICMNRGCKKPKTSTRGGKVCTCENPLWRYQINVTDPISGKRIQYSYKTKREAEAEEGKLKSLKRENKSFLEVKPGYSMTFRELAEKYESFKRDDVKRFDENIKKPLERAKEHFGELLLASIGSYELSEFMSTFKKDFELERGHKPSASTVNKQVHVLSNLFSMAVEWGDLDKTPFEKLNGRRRTLRVQEHNREVFLEPEEVNRLITEAPEHLKPIIIVAVNTGMRRGEILGLKWSQISKHWIYLKQTKTDYERQVPINADVDAVLKQIRTRQMADGTFKKDGRVFLKGERPLASIKTAWYATCRRAGVEARFHDLRHTFASWYLKERKNLAALQKLLGHREITMTMRYAHIIQDDLREEAESLAGMVNANLSLTQPPKLRPANLSRSA